MNDFALHPLKSRLADVLTAEAAHRSRVGRTPAERIAIYEKEITRLMRERVWLTVLLLLADEHGKGMVG